MRPTRKPLAYGVERTAAGEVAELLAVAIERR
jgi:hypothetical protein